MKKTVYSMDEFMEIQRRKQVVKEMDQQRKTERNKPFTSVAMDARASSMGIDRNVGSA